MNATRASRLALALSLCLAVPGCDDADPVETDAGPAQTDAGPAETDAGPAETDAGPEGDTWANFGEAFMAEYCAPCHDEAPRDYTTVEGVRAELASIRCGTSDVMLDDCGSWPPARQFPVGSGPFPSDAERARLVAWLDAGAP